MMYKQRKAFSMLVAIFVIMILSLVASYIFYANSTTAKVGQLQYQRAQAMLLARSYTEYAVLAIQGHNRNVNSGCVNKIVTDIGANPEQGQGFKVIVKISYIGNQKYIQNCGAKTAQLANPNITNQTAPEDTLMAIVDVYVKYKDMQHQGLSAGANNSVPWHTYHRRSLQKI